MSDLAEQPIEAATEPHDAQGEELGIVPHRFAALVALIALMAILGGWELLLIVGILVGFIIIHELGHFLTARWSGMLATEFFIGFGARIVSFKRGETTYGIKALPFGAYVRIAGMNNLDEVDPDDEPRAYRNKPWHKRFLTVAAGPATHFVMAVLLAVLVFWHSGQPVDGQWQVDTVLPFSAAERAGLEEGDQIKAINGVEVEVFDELADLIPQFQGELVTLDIERGGELISVETRIGESLTATGARGYEGLYANDQIVAFDGRAVENYAEFARLASERIGETVPVDVVYRLERHQELVTINSVVTDGAVAGFLGVSRGDVFEPMSLSEATTEAVPRVGEITAAIATGFGDLFTSADGWRGLFALPAENSADGGTVIRVEGDQVRPLPEIDENRLTSIVGAVSIGQQLVDDGVGAVLAFFVLLNISLGMINLVPLLPFDGGHMAVATYERIRSFGGREHRVDAAKLLPLTYAVVVFMLLVGGIAIVRDIVDPLQIPS